MIRILTAGESHGEALIGIVEGMPAGVAVSTAEIDRHLARRWLGYGRGGRAKIERDKVHVYSGVRFGRTIGSPIALKLSNAAHQKDRSRWPEVMAVEGTGEGIERVTLPRPGHADLVGVQKYGFDDIRPVIERSSARETAMRVACCTLARLFLKELGIEIGSHVLQIGDVAYSSDAESELLRDAHVLSGAEAINESADQSEVRMLSPELSAACVKHIAAVKKEGDSLGGRYEIVVTGVPAGLGTYVHSDRRLDGQIAQAVLSIQGQKAVEIGDGVSAAGHRGSRFHDEIASDGGTFTRRSNRAGGIEGGVSNGMPLIIRGYMKPIPTLVKPLGTVDIETLESQPTRYERSDVTSVPAASTVAEAAVALVVANSVLEKFGGDSLAEIAARFQG